jgi:hypothetical protein
MQRVVTVAVPMPTGGVTNDPRDRAAAMCRVITNFDIVTDRRRAIPYYDSEDGSSSQANQDYRNWAVALRTGATYSLYALGVVTGTGKAQIDYKNLTTGGSTDLSDATYTATSNNASAAGASSMDLFVYYAKTGRIYGAKSGTTIWAYDPSGSVAFNDASHSLAYTNISQGLVHSQDDILYIPYDNKIASNNNGTWTDAALTLPSQFVITSICEYGPYLAIAASPNNNVGNSRVFIWDRNSSLTTVYANIDWGGGQIKVLEEIQGYLVGISYATDSSRTTYRVTFRYYSGTGGAIPFKELTTSAIFTLTTSQQRKQKLNTRIYFLLSASINGSQREGVWSVSKLPNEDFVVAHERTPNNDTQLTASGALFNFFIVGDFFFIAYADSSSNHHMSKTNDQPSYTATSIIETVVNPNMPEEDKGRKKKLISVGAMYDPLPSAGIVVVKERTNLAGGGNYTSVFSETTDSAVKTEPVPVPSGGTYLNDGEEFEFRLESTGGAVPTYLIYKYAIDESNM